MRQDIVLQQFFNPEAIATLTQEQKYPNCIVEVAVLEKNSGETIAKCH